PNNDDAVNTTAYYGQLRVIDPSDTTAANDQGAAETDVYSCRPEEATITWNQQGQQGLPGAQGRQGPPGQSGGNGGQGSSGGWSSDTSYGVSAGGGTGLYLTINGIQGGSASKITTVGSWSQVNNKSDVSGAEVHGPLAETSSKHKSKSGPNVFSTSSKTENGLIALKEFALGSETPVTNGSAFGASTGAGAGKVQNIQTFEFVKSVDKTSSQLYNDLTHSTVIRSAEVIVTHNSKNVHEQVAGYKFSDLIIKSISDSGKTEKVTGVFRAVNTQLGSGKQSVSASWNKVQNVADEATLVPGS
ncbi:MAG: type VI secretion system tube protein Hcp, partial [Solirubrobacteraceae bacterium]